MLYCADSADSSGRYLNGPYLLLDGGMVYDYYNTYLEHVDGRQLFAEVDEFLSQPDLQVA